MYDIESTRRARQAVGWLPWRRRQRTREVAAIRAIEKRAAESADRVWVCSSLDADRFTAVTGRRVGIHVVPNGVPRADSVPTQMRPRADSSRLAPVLLMAGHLAYRPNVLAAEFAARAILPRLRKHLPGARLVLAGRAPHRRVRALASDAVDVIADPPDMTPMLRDADMSVMPLTEGGGTRVKMAEAMAWGLPVVATAMAAEGLGLQDGRHYRRAESAAQFATAIAELWHDGPLFEATRQAAREFALREFGPDAIARAVARGLGGADPS
jgi:glycosyltransferase involved in cell wall biosynthesis